MFNVPSFSSIWWNCFILHQYALSFINFSVSITSILDFLTIQMAGICVLFLNIGGYAILLFLHYFNKKRYRSSLYNVDKYTLSERYQLQENIKSAVLMQRVALFIFCMNLTIGIAFTVSYYFQGYVFHRSCYVVFNLTISLYAYVFPLVGITSNESWRSFLIRTLQKMTRISPSELTLESRPNEKRESLTRTVRGFEGKRIIFTIEEEKEVYFNQLQMNWN